MSLFQTNKPKSAGKIMIPPSERLDDAVLKTLEHTARMVGATLGPGGKQVLIERPEVGMRPIISKDGVTVIKSLGYHDAISQLILEAARDAALRTASEAGDGPQPLYSEVLTPTGFIKMGDVKVGMELCGTNGTIQKVIGVFPKGEKEIYEIEFSDGRTVECCSDHLWKVTYDNGTEAIKTTATLKEDYRKTSKGYVKYKYYIPNTVVEFHENKAEMPLDPYLVGLLLGDGSLSGAGSIELSLGIPKKHILDKLVLPKGIAATTTFVESRNYYRVKLTGVTPDGRSMNNIVQSLGLLGSHSSTKFIPKSYLYASRQTRERLLQGMVDTDGHINTRGRFEYSTVSDELCGDFLSLVQSLGIATYHGLLDRKPNSSYSENSIHRITELKGYKYGTKIVKITPTGRRTPMQCIKVSNTDNLYITDNFIVTHNTTTATILSSSIANATAEVVRANRKFSPQKIVREMEKLVPIIETFLQTHKLPVTEDNYQEVLTKVASLSANGDVELAKVVMEAFDLVGEEGNLTIVEATGQSKYEIERLNGYTIEQGYEESCRNFANGFINDKSGTLVTMTNPLFVLYDGVLNDLNGVYSVFNLVNQYFDEVHRADRNVVIVAHGFSETVIGELHVNWTSVQSQIKVFPMLTPQMAIMNWRTHFLYDLQAYTGSPVFNPIDRPMADLVPADLARVNRVTYFEVGRFRSTVVATEDMSAIEMRVEELKLQQKRAESDYELRDLELRIGKLTSGIARLNIYGPSQGETREKRDRAEDAWMAIRGTIKHGACPGGGFVLVKAAASLAVLSETLEVGGKKMAAGILSEALLVPVRVLYQNYGYVADEIESQLTALLLNEMETYDIYEQKWVPKFDLLDSVPAVMESIRSAISIASLLGTLGGIIAFGRDAESDLKEQQFVERFEKGAGINE